MPPRRHRLMRWAVALPLLLGLPAQAAAQDGAGEEHEFSGTWQLIFETDRGTNQWDLRVEVEGATLSGEADSNMGLEFPLEGRQTGDRVNFIVYIDVPGHEVELLFSGEIEDGVAEGEVQIDGATYLWSASQTER